jgi:hypothetical protein
MSSLIDNLRSLAKSAVPEMTALSDAILNHIEIARTGGTKSPVLSLGFGKHQARVVRWLTAHDLKLADRLLGPDTAAENLSASRAK